MSLNVIFQCLLIRVNLSIIIFVVYLNVNVSIYFFIALSCDDSVNGFAIFIFNVLCRIDSIDSIKAKLICFWDNMEFLRRLVENWRSCILIFYLFIDQWFVDERLAKLFFGLVIVWKRVIVLVDSLVVGWLSLWICVRRRGSNHAFSFCFYHTIVGPLVVFCVHTFIYLFLHKNIFKIS